MVRNRKCVAGIILALCCLMFLGGCAGSTAGSNGDDSDNGKIKIVTTVFPAYDFARQVAGERAEVMLLLSPGEELHSYEPSPKEMIAIGECDLFIYVGGESDTWIKGVLETIDENDKAVISMMEVVDVLTEEITEGMVHSHWNGLWGWLQELFHSEDGDHDGKHAHEDGEVCDDPDHRHETEYDEHVWTSPENAGVIVSAIADTLCGLDPEGESVYRRNEKAYLGELEQLTNELLAVRKRAVRDTIIVADRFPYRYLAEFLDVEYYAAFPGCAEETEPSAKTVAFLIDKIRQEEIPVVFYQEFSSHMMAETIAADTGAKALLLHSCHNVTKKEFESGVTYLDLMRQNMEALEQALCE